MTAAAVGAERRLTVGRLPGWARWAALLAVVAVLYAAFRDTFLIPHDDSAPAFQALNDVRDAVEASRSNPLVAAVVGGIQTGVGWLAETLMDVLHAAGWLGVLGVAVSLGWLVGGWRLALLQAAGFLSLGVLDLWADSMDTLGITLAAVLLALAVGVPLGILAGRSERVRRVIAPILDVLQIAPTYSYLAPVALFFLIGATSATIVTFIYAVPATIRITALGIAGLPKPTLEAAHSLGATGWQRLRKVELPMAARVIGLAVNQTIMLSLSMVVITAIIAGPGLGERIYRALAAVDVGRAFDAGLAIVILAVVLDRLTETVSHRLDTRVHAAGPEPGPVPAGPRGLAVRAARRSAALSTRSRALIALAVAVVAVLGAQTMEEPDEFPEDVASFSFREPVNALVDTIEDVFGPITVAIKDGFSFGVLNPLEGALTSAPWWLVIVATAGIALLVSGARAAIVSIVVLAVIAWLRIWEHTMSTIALVIVALAVTMLIGILLGIWSARSDRVQRALRPLLDLAQTMPAFVYLIPALALFEPTRFTGIVAAVIFAVPPVIRLVDAGIRAVPATTLEAAVSTGTDRRQLLWKVQLPVARPALLLAGNQGIVMVLGMVVVAGLVGAQGLGYDVVAGLAQREDYGKGLAASIALVLLGIMLDRITQGAGRRREVTVRGA